MSNANYNLPTTKKEKVELLNDILAGKKTIDDLKETGYTIVMWREDDQDPGYMQTFDGKQRISKADYEANKIASKAIKITLELNPVSY